MKKFASSSKGLFSTLCLSLALTGMAHAQVFDFTDFDTQGNTWSAELERGAPANRVEVLDDVTIERFELYTNSRVDHQLHFFIYDINNEVLATNVRSYTVIAYLDESRTSDEANPRHVVDKETTAEKLSPLINMTPKQILKLLNTKNKLI